MTPKERAIEATWDTGAGDWTTVDRKRLESRVEQAIIAAVEEEREACARIADEIKVHNWSYTYSAHGGANMIAERIRARSAPAE